MPKMKASGVESRGSFEWWSGTFPSRARGSADQGGGVRRLHIDAMVKAGAFPAWRLPACRHEIAGASTRGAPVTAWEAGERVSGLARRPLLRVHPSEGLFINCEKRRSPASRSTAVPEYTVVRAKRWRACRKVERADGPLPLAGITTYNRCATAARGRRHGGSAGHWVWATSPSSMRRRWGSAPCHSRGATRRSWRGSSCAHDTSTRKAEARRVESSAGRTWSRHRAEQRGIATPNGLKPRESCSILGRAVRALALFRVLAAQRRTWRVAERQLHRLGETMASARWPASGRGSRRSMLARPSRRGEGDGEPHRFRAVLVP